MDKYYVVDYKIQLSKQGGGALPKVKYKIQIIQNNKVAKELYDVTDDKGQMKNLLLEANCQLKIFVEGFKNPFMKKKEWMVPIFSKSEESNIIDVDDKNLLKNIKFISELEYKAKKEQLKNTIEKAKANVSYGDFIKNQNLQNVLMTTNPWLQSTVASLNELGSSYAEYKKKCTKKINKNKLFYLKTYAVFQFVDSRLKPIQNIKYQVFEKNNTKPVLNNYPSSATQNGMTGIAYTVESSQVKYKVGNDDKTSDYFPPTTCVNNQQINLVKIGISLASTYPNSDHTIGLGKSIRPPIIVNPHTDELLILPQDAFDTFEKITKDLEQTIHLTKNELDEKMKFIAKSNSEIQEVEKRLNINQQKAIEKINTTFSNKSEIVEVLVLETIGNTKNGEKKFLRKYLNKRDYEKLKTKKINTQTHIKIKDAILKSGKTGGNLELDIKKMDESFKALQQNLSIELANKKFGGKEKLIIDCIESINHEIGYQYKNSQGTDVSVEAQWLRMVAGNGGEASMSVTNKGTTIKAKGDASAKIVLFEGRKEWRSFFPSENGWNLALGDIALGTIRFIRGCSLSGFAGANIGLAGNLSVDVPMTVGEPQMAYPTTRTPKRSNANSGGRLEPTDKDFDKVTENQAAVEVKAFAGAQVGVALMASLEWYNDKTEQPAKFVTLAAAAPAVGGSIGGGFEGKFQIFIQGGKFKFRLAVHVCWGIGAKGSLDFEVDTQQMWHFALFVKSQLLQASFTQLLYIHEIAFMGLARILAYCIGDNHPLTQSVNQLLDDYTVWISGVSLDQKRYAVALNINSPSGLQGLVSASPETKGILIYAVTHWTTRTASLLDMTISLTPSGLEVNRFVARKNAVINIFKTCISTQEWMNVIQHVHPRADSQSESAMQKIEGDIIRFLNYGEDDSIAEAIIYAINKGVDYAGGQENSWLKDYLKYRKQAKPIQGYPLNKLIVRNQDDMEFKKLEYIDGYAENDAILASNIDVLTPFEENQDIQLYQA